MRRGINLLLVLLIGCSKSQVGLPVNLIQQPKRSEIFIVNNSANIIISKVFFNNILVDSNVYRGADYVDSVTYLDSGNTFSIVIRAYNHNAVQNFPDRLEMSGGDINDQIDLYLVPPYETVYTINSCKSDLVAWIGEDSCTVCQNPIIKQ